MSAVLKPMLAGTGVSLDVFDGAFENEASMCVSTPASSRPLVGGLQVLTELLRLEVEKQHAALRSPATDDRRAAIGEGLWCLLLFLESVFCAHQYLPPPCSSGQPVGTGATCSLPGSAGGNSDGSMMAGNGSAPNNAQGNPPDQRGAVHLQSCPGGGGELQRTGDREFGATGAAGDTTALVLTAVQAEEASVKALRDTSPDLVSLFVRLIFEGFQGVLLRREREATLGRGEGSLSSQIGGCAHLGIVGAPMSAEVPVPSTSAAAAGLAAARDFVGSGSESGGLSEQRSSERGGEGIDATTSDLQIDGERERLERFNGNGADILVPALKLLSKQFAQLHRLIASNVLRTQRRTLRTDRCEPWRTSENCLTSSGRSTDAAGPRVAGGGSVHGAATCAGLHGTYPFIGKSVFGKHQRADLGSGLDAVPGVPSFASDRQVLSPCLGRMFQIVVRPCPSGKSRAEHGTRP